MLPGCLVVDGNRGPMFPPAPKQSDLGRRLSFDHTPKLLMSLLLVTYLRSLYCSASNETAVMATRIGRKPLSVGRACFRSEGFAVVAAADDHDRAGGMLGALAADRAEQQAGEAAVAA